MHFVYIVRCTDGSLYTGYTRDPRARTLAHNAGRGARYTSGRRPVRLVYSEAFDTLSEALKREYELKQWPRARKQALVRSARRTLKLRPASSSKSAAPSPAFPSPQR
jgi:putative endonuclease